jgi:hypothetical protein
MLRRYTEERFPLRTLKAIGRYVFEDLGFEVRPCSLNPNPEDADRLNAIGR